LISIVCVYNNRNILDKYLIKSLKEQSSNYELILVDNTAKRFKSAAEALNFGGEKANEKFIAFIHQDICFNSRFLEDLETILNRISNLGIAGLAGVSETTPGVISNIKQGKSSEIVGKNQIETPTKVQTLDECMILIPKSVFEILKFDEITCDNWHLYGVDYSLSAISMGKDSYVLPLSIYHRSPGYSMSDGYNSTLKKLLKKHNQNFKLIYTTLGNYHTSIPLNLQNNMKKVIVPLIKALRLWKYD
jgi:Glycosyltransferase like family